MFILLIISYSLHILILLYLIDRFIWFNRFIYQTIYIYHSVFKMTSIRYILGTTKFKALSLFWFGYNWFGFSGLNTLLSPI